MWAIKDCMLANWKNFIIAVVIAYVAFRGLQGGLADAFKGLTLAALLSYGMLNTKTSGAVQYYAVARESNLRALLELVAGYSLVACVAALMTFRSPLAAVSAALSAPAFMISSLLLPEALARVAPVALIVALRLVPGELTLTKLLVLEALASAVALVSIKPLEERAVGW